MRQAIDGLAGNLNRELEEDEWARNIVYLLEALAFQYDSEQLHTALNAMNDFFAGRGMEAYENVGFWKTYARCVVTASILPLPMSRPVRPKPCWRAGWES